MGLGTEFQNTGFDGIGLRWSLAVSMCGVRGGKVSTGKILIQEWVPSHWLHWWLCTPRNGCSPYGQPAAARPPFGNCQYCLRTGSSESLRCLSAYWLLWDCRYLNMFLYLTQSSPNPFLAFPFRKSDKWNWLVCLGSIKVPEEARTCRHVT